MSLAQFDLTMQSFKERLQQMNADIVAIENTVSMIQSSIQNYQNSIATITKALEDYDKLYGLFVESSKVARNTAKQHFEQIVTDALQFVLDDTDYKFIIEDTSTAKKAQYEFYVENTINGKTNRQTPENACGGGLIDIISVALKFAYLQIFNDPVIKSNVLILDEPGKMISEQASLKFSEYIKFINQTFGKQIIMVTHNDSLSTVSDKTIQVAKSSNGVSVCKELIGAKEVESIDLDVKKIVEEN